MFITAEMKMADLIHLDFRLLAVTQRIGIPLGFKEKTVNEVCIENNINIDFFLLLVNIFHDAEYLPKDNYLDLKSDWFIKFLRRAHLCYINHKIPEIEKKIDELISEIKESTDNYILIKNFFTEYINEFTIHINLEEKTVFPYILSLSKCIKEGKKTDTFLKRFSGYNIDKYLTEHSDIEDKLFDLKNILIKYLAPPMDNCKYNSLLFELFNLETDLQRHSKIEEQILIPKVRQMELEIKNL